MSEEFEKDRADIEARANATRGPLPRARPFRLGCALVVVALVGNAWTFAVSLLAAFCAHRWGLS